MSAFPTSSRAALRLRRRNQGGFTLIELTVALLSGLIVGMGVIALSREATTTFNDDGRASASEASLRSAMDRLRSDLERAGFMTTGNILLDPASAQAPGAKPGQGNAAGYQPGVASGAKVGMSGLQGLASIFWLDKGSNGATGGVANGLTLSGYQSPVLSPDLIQIAGNMTTAEKFEVESITGSGICPNTKIRISATSPATLRLFGGAAPTTSNGAILGNAFEPDGVSQFLVRLVDGSGKAQYLATCATGSGTSAAGVDATGPFVAIDTSITPIFTAAAPGAVSRLGGAAGLCAGCWVNPVQIVQWEITKSGAPDNEPGSDSVLSRAWNDQTTGADTTKYDLMRSYLDATGAIAAGTREIVAEYAVDLSFAFTGDTGAAIVSCAFDDNVCNAPWGVSINTPSSPSGPQRIRTVRARVATRTAQADRTLSVPVVPGNYTGQSFLYRYAFATGNGPPFARVRTLTTEVALINQMRNNYP